MKYHTMYSDWEIVDYDQIIEWATDNQPEILIDGDFTSSPILDKALDEIFKLSSVEGELVTIIPSREDIHGRHGCFMVPVVTTRCDGNTEVQEIKFQWFEKL